MSDGAASRAKQRRSRAKWQAECSNEWRSQPSEATAICSKTAARSGTSKTGLMNFTLRNQGVGSVKKGVLFERSEFQTL